MFARRIVLLFLAFVFFSARLLALPVINFSSGVNRTIGDSVEILEDKTNALTIADVMHSNAFKLSTQKVPNLGVSASTFWIRLTIHNSVNIRPILLDLGQPTLDTVGFYAIKGDSMLSADKVGEFKPFNTRKYEHQDYIFELNIPQNEERTYYLSIRSGDQMMAPLTIGSPRRILENDMQKDMMFGVFFGILLVMFLYNLFIFFTVRDRTYLFYCLYTLLELLNLGTLYGYTFRFLWPDSLWLANNAIYLLACFADIAAVMFVRSFLNTRSYTPKADKVLIVTMSVFFIAAALVFVGQTRASFGIMQLNTLITSFYVLYVSYRVYAKGYRPALFFLVAWSGLLVGAVLYVLKDFGILPYTTFTSSTLVLGSIFEVILLSFALADKINIFRKEKEESQAQAMAALEENARIIREQNVVLEEKVNERTLELQQSNAELNQAYRDLQEKESQLVESEKMASLGQLTAGIAHEINNPINFVTSNVNPLKRDVGMLIDMLEKLEGISVGADSQETKQQQISELKEEFDFDYLKTEIDYLLKGINEGSTRTAEIVKGLRIFSRLDEDDLKKANINDGLESTTIIVNNLLENKVEIIRDYGNIPMVECYPGKLNQVFLNIITNGIHAVKSKLQPGQKGQIIIKTYNNEDSVFISIKDTGIGMDENTKKKLFEPFFTTKDVGEGTGLGLSIAWNTIKKHNGTITVNSELGVGTEFLLEIPIIHKEVKNE